MGLRLQDPQLVPEGPTAGQDQLFCIEKGDEQDPTPDPRTDFQEFVFRKGREFEEVVIAHVATVEPVFYEPSGVQAASHQRKAQGWTVEQKNRPLSIAIRLSPAWLPPSHLDAPPAHSGAA